MFKKKFFKKSRNSEEKKTPKKTLLTMRNIDEVSFVDEGEGVDVPILITKQKKGSAMNKRELMKLLKRFLKQEGEPSSGKTLEEVLEGLNESDAAIIMAALAEAAEVDKENADDEENKADEEEDKVDNEENKADEEEDKVDNEENKADEEEDKAGSEINKRLKSANIKLQKRVAELEEKEEVARFEKQAKELQYIPGMKTTALSKTLRVMSKSLSTTEFNAMIGSLKAANNMIRDNIAFHEIGSIKGDSTAMNEIDKRVSKMLTDNPEMKRPQAFSKVIKADPKLYEQYTEEKKVNAIR